MQDFLESKCSTCWTDRSNPHRPQHYHSLMRESRSHGCRPRATRPLGPPGTCDYGPGSSQKAALGAHTAHSVGPESRPGAEGRASQSARSSQEGPTRPPQASSVCGIHRKTEVWYLPQKYPGLPGGLQSLTHSSCGDGGHDPRVREVRNLAPIVALATKGGLPPGVQRVSMM